MSNFYGDDIFAVDEGYIFHSKEARRIRKEVKEELKEYSGGFFTKWKSSRTAEKSVNKEAYDAAVKVLKSKFNKIHITKPVIKEETHAVSMGDTTYYITIQYWAVCACGFINDIIMNFMIPISSAGLGSPSIYDARVKGSRSYTIQELNDLYSAIPDNDVFCIHYNGHSKTLRIWNEDYRSEQGRLKALGEKIMSKFGDKYTVKTRKLWEYVSVTKNK